MSDHTGSAPTRNGRSHSHGFLCGPDNDRGDHHRTRTWSHRIRCLYSVAPVPVRQVEISVWNSYFLTGEILLLGTADTAGTPQADHEI